MSSELLSCMRAFLLGPGSVAWLFAPVVMLAPLLPAAAFAQERGRIHFEGNAGVYFPDLGGFGDQKTGWTAGGRVALPLRNRMDLFVHYSYAAVDESDRTGVAPDFVITGIRQQLFTAGADLGLGGPLRLELALGAVSQRSRVDRVEGNPDPTFFPDGRGGDESDWTYSAAAVPGISYRILNRAVIRVRDLMILDDVLARHNISISIGARI